MTSLWRDDIDPDHDLHKVMIKRDKLVDSARDGRIVKIKVYYPVLEPNSNVQEKLPVIVWSHGLGGSVDGSAFQSRFVASHGYVVVHVQHHGTDSSLWEGKEGHPWDIIRQTNIPRSATLDRFKDIPFALDQLPEWLKQYPEIEAIADLSNMGMSGHSFGALTTQVMAGMMFPDDSGKLRRAREERFKVGILYSPGPISHLSMDDPADINGLIDMPLLHITGTEDSSPVEDWDYLKRLVIYENTHKVEKHLLIIKDGDHMVFTGSRGKLGQNPHREKHERILKTISLAYWDAMLKDDNVAKSWLNDGGFAEWLGEEGEFSQSLTLGAFLK
jgi:predicted dienelactone hydrolase